MQVNIKKTIPKFYLFLSAFLFTQFALYAHGDYSELITNPFVFGAPVFTFVVFSSVIKLINRSWNPPVELSYWKLGLSLIAISGIIYVLGMRDYFIGVLFLLFVASMIPAIVVAVTNELTTGQKFILFLLSTVTYFVGGGVCGFFYLSSLQ
ncbi:MAG: hypothetical protein KBF99_07235 [Leptospiraceae bacterium]|nr:hypothetical protein [Leptospiraceae bacterium]MBK7053528.1 hypothetical protein [Leptospiraceae bacterium]MBK9500346.1 hypothetical protein [Leptospiraceae bacterium]MBP9162959.1 hypothetical protein [Leptospiraceae bacterium]